MSNRIVVLGATSKIAQEVARLAAAERKHLLLVARNAERLARVAGDLSARGAVVQQVTADLASVTGHAALVDEIARKMPDFDTVLLAYGSLSDQARSEESADYAISELDCNFTSAVSLLTRLSVSLMERRAGCIAIITSVAGDRGRRSNYLYGSAKGALSLFAQGLRAKLLPSGIRVLTIKPGPIATPMTARMPRHDRFADPSAVARTIYREIEHGKSDILYVPRYWRYVMFVVRHIPERIAKRLNF